MYVRVEWRLGSVLWCPDHLENSIISPLHAIIKHRHTHMHTHTHTRLCPVSYHRLSSAERVGPVGSISGRALLDFSDVLQRSQRSRREWMPLTPHHQTGLSFCVFVSRQIREMGRRKWLPSGKRWNKSRAGKCLFFEIFWITTFV